MENLGVNYISEETIALDTAFEKGPGYLWIPEDATITVETLKPGGRNDSSLDSEWQEVEFVGVLGGHFFPVLVRKITSYDGVDIEECLIGYK